MVHDFMTSYLAVDNFQDDEYKQDLRVSWPSSTLSYLLGMDVVFQNSSHQIMP
jgi:hypothetical protein